ncbi:MAG: DUF4349 domain-containing protein [Gemmatimonadota bacterium]|nr:DUF4349 domain-containing protein [Gemmatimonadota bacterium]
MNRRITTILVCTASVALAAAASCGGDAPPSVAPANATPGGTAGFGAAGSDAPVPAPLPPYGPTDETAARTRAAARRAAARQAASARAAANEMVPTTGAAVQVTSGAAPPVQSAQVGAMLIRRGQAVIEVDSVQVGIARVRRLAQESGALVANTSVQTGREQQRSASLELRIPSDRFDAVVNGLSPIGKVESVSITAQDVGEEFVDLSARVANARRLEARLIQLLATRAGRLTDVLSVERELARVREEIERYEGRLRYLQAHVSVSSLTVVVHEPPPVVASHPGENVIAEAFVEAWRRFVLLTAGFIASLGVVIPVAAIGLGVLVLGRRYLPRKHVVAEG